MDLIVPETVQATQIHDSILSSRIYEGHSYQYRTASGPSMVAKSAVRTKSRALQRTEQSFTRIKVQVTQQEGFEHVEAQ
jgi:hypothetical protein